MWKRWWRFTLHKSRKFLDLRRNYRGRYFTRYFTRYVWQGRRPAYSKCVFVSWFGYKCSALWIVLHCAYAHWYFANVPCSRLGIVETSSWLYEFASLYLIYLRFIWSKTKTFLKLISLYEHILEYCCYRRRKWFLSESHFIRRIFLQLYHV